MYAHTFQPLLPKPTYGLRTGRRRPVPSKLSLNKVGKKFSEMITPYINFPHYTALPKTRLVQIAMALFRLGPKKLERLATDLIIKKRPSQNGDDVGTTGRHFGRSLFRQQG